MNRVFVYFLKYLGSEADMEMESHPQKNTNNIFFSLLIQVKLCFTNNSIRTKKITNETTKKAQREKFPLSTSKINCAKKTKLLINQMKKYIIYIYGIIYSLNIFINNKLIHTI